jgi:hypothetical protein
MIVLMAYLSSKFLSHIELGNNFEILNGEEGEEEDFLYRPHILCSEGYLPEKILGIIALL